MYSMVLMMALSSGASTPATFFNGCHGGGACNGGCVGAGGGACAGWGGCNGGGHRLFGGGCNGGGHRLFGGGCNGGCHGLLGGHRLFGGGCNGGYACNGGGCAGVSHACHGGGGCAGTVGVPVKKETLPPPKEKGKEKSALPAPATMIVSLPAEATLTIDDQPTVSSSSTRVFASPALQPGTEYVYTLKAEIVRDGTPVRTEKRISVRAGEQVRVNLELPVATASR